MIKEDIKTYRTVTVLFFVISIMLLFLNYHFIKGIKTRQVVNFNVVKDKETIKKYGYSDILNIVSKDANIEINNIANSLENKNIIEVDMKYNGNIMSLNNTLNNFSNEESFYNVQNIKVYKNIDGNLQINVIAKFIKNK